MKKILFFIFLFLAASPAFATTQTISVLGGSWATGTTWVSGSAPAAGDDVVATALSGNLVIDSNTNALRSFDLTGYTGTLSGSSNLVVRGENSSTVPILFAGTSNTWNGLVSITTGGTSRVYNLTAGGNALAAITMNATSGGTLSLQDTLNCGTSTITLTNGAIRTNGVTVTMGIFSSNNSNTRTFDFTNSTLNIGSTGTIWNMATSSNSTITSTGSTINITDTSSSNKTINIGGSADTSATHLNNVDISGSGTGTVIWTSSASFSIIIDGNFTIHPPKTVRVTVSNAKGVTVTGTFTATGTSGNLITLNSTTAGTSAFWTLNGSVTADYLSLKDVTNNGSSAPVNVGNNSTGVSNVVGFYSTKTISNGGGNFNSTSSWVEAQIPSVIDKVVATGTSGNLAINVNSNCYSFDLTNYVGALSGSSNTLTLNAAGGGTHNFILNGTVTWTGTLNLTIGTSTTINVTLNGKTLGGDFNFNGLGTASLQDNLNIGAHNFSNTQGTFNSNGKAMTFNNTTTLGATATTNISNSTVTMNGTSTIWGITAGHVLSASGSTFIITDTSASSKTFAGGGLTYGALQITGGGAGAVIFTGANTFAGWTISGGTKNITLPGTTTTTITASSGLGNSTNVITFTASAGSATISSPSGTFSWDYVNLTNIPSTGGASFYAGANSTDGGGNTGWTFTAPPAGVVVKTINGLALGSVKTFNGLAIGSVKKINGLAAQ